jgi:hypothetical protein
MAELSLEGSHISKPFRQGHVTRSQIVNRADPIIRAVYMSNSDESVESGEVQSSRQEFPSN